MIFSLSTALFQYGLLLNQTYANGLFLAFLASKGGVLFISREKRHDAGRIVHSTASSLEAGDNLCLFPEGTTTEGDEVKRFKSSLIQAALH